MMQNLLEQAGFPGVEAEGDSLWARLSATGPEFRADPHGEAWILTLSWPVRLDAATLARWNSNNPAALLDLAGGETRLRMGAESAADLETWARAAESMVQTCLAYRRGQRARGEGM
ncbi:hypothetical protein HOY34_04890 [Xinfangfangia sp. D13-10-4-6]|uniref:hypothetical protein n=1 Tax=Pseudogemmobacter hezensis TaxID=2737662 RepID=UPI0015526913|nr:hypothetical protein [Pseudogemmobacter hezensis]NPD14537.1 hypothetical protein [Pseudogemmobacter hezensis]